MRSELRNEMLRVLEEAQGVDGIVLSFGKHQELTIEAVQLLEAYGALWRRESDRYTITIHGYKYREALKAPRGYWLEKNWFAVAVLGVTSVVTVVANLLVVWLS